MSDILSLPQLEANYNWMVKNLSSDFASTWAKNWAEIAICRYRNGLDTADALSRCIAHLLKVIEQERNRDGNAIR